ncbi:MAG: metalloregulator ArsR/SmtB family transcription factor [Phycisphaerales bacterium]
MKARTSIPISTRLSAIADDVRLRAARLLESEELTVGELASVLQLPQSTASRNLKALANAGWLRSRQVGTSTLYRLTLDDLTTADRSVWIALRVELDGDPDVVEDARRLCAVLEARKTDSVAYFGRVAGEWDEVRNELFGRGFTAPALLGLLPRDWTVADLGCGTGNASAYLAPHVKQVIAVDQSGPMLEAASRRLEGFENIRFVEGGLGSLPIEDGSVDASVAILVLHHVRDAGAALRDVRRITRPGGLSLVVDMYEHHREEYRDTMGHHHLGFAEGTLTDLYTASGFEAPRITPIPSSTIAKGPSLFVATARAV